MTWLPASIELDHVATYPLVALLAAIAGLIGIVFKNVLHKTEYLCDRAWPRPGWNSRRSECLMLGPLLFALALLG